MTAALRKVPLDLVLLGAVAVVAVIAIGFWASQGRAVPTPSPAPTAAPVFGTPAPRVVDSDALVQRALRHADVQVFAVRNPGYEVEEASELTLEEVSALGARYPVIYGNLTPPAYQLRLGSPSSDDGLLVLLNDREVLRVFAVQRLRVG